MNALFNFKRWLLLVGLHWAENRRTYLLALIAIGGLLLVWFSFIIAMDRNSALSKGYQVTAYFVGLYFIGCLFGSQVFSVVNRKREAIQYLMVPASHLEKLLCGLLFGVVFFFIVYTGLFYLVDIPLVRLMERVPGVNPGRAVVNIMDEKLGVYNIFSSKDDYMKGLGPLLLLIFFSVQAAFILGSVYFTRLAVLKSILSILLLCLLSTLFLSKVLNANLPDGWRLDSLFDWFRFDPAGAGEWVRLPSSVGDTLSALAMFGLPFIFWVVTYFRLKEKEV